MRRNDLISGDVIVAELHLDAVAERRKHVGEDENFAPDWMVLLLRGRLELQSHTTFLQRSKQRKRGERLEGKAHHLSSKVHFNHGVDEGFRSSSDRLLDTRKQTEVGARQIFASVHDHSIQCTLSLHGNPSRKKEVAVKRILLGAANF